MSLTLRSSGWRLDAVHGPDMTLSLPVTTSVRPRPRMVASLIAGRGGFRVANQLSVVALAVVWGTQTFGAYANAVGVCAWLIFVSAGAEKAALKLAPRHPRLTRDIVAQVILIACVPLAAALISLAAALLVAGAAAATVYLAAAAVSSCTGLLLVVAGLHRLSGRPGYDVAAFLVAAASIGVITTLTWALDLQPLAQLLMILAVSLTLLAMLLAALPANWRPGHRRRRGVVTKHVLQSSFLLGANDILDAAGISIVFAILAISGRTAQSGPLLLALIAAGAVGSLLVFLLRLAQPSVSLRQRGRGGQAGRRRAALLLQWAQWLGLAVAIALAVAVVVATTSGDGSALSSTGALAVLVVAEILMFAVVSYAVFLVENTDHKVLKVTASAALVGFGATVGLGAALAWFGAAGALGAVVVGLAVKATVLRHWLGTSRLGGTRRLGHTI